MKYKIVCFSSQRRTKLPCSFHQCVAMVTSNIASVDTSGQRKNVTHSFTTVKKDGWDCQDLKRSAVHPGGVF